MRAMIAAGNVVVHSGSVCRRVMICVALKTSLACTYIDVFGAGVKSVSFLWGRDDLPVGQSAAIDLIR